MIPDLARAKVAIGSIFDLLDTLESNESRELDGQRPDNPIGEVKVSHITFGYPRHKGRKVLKGIVEMYLSCMLF
jgi:ABC-type multidrug transport system fused ATPase/permease subunit